MKKVIIILIILAILGAVFYFVYPIVKERYFTEEASEEEKETGIEIKIKPGETSGEETPPSMDGGQPAEEKEDSELQEIPEINESDCENECENYKDDGEKLLYCREVCGLKKPKAPAGSCDDKTGLDKDYCLKDKAIGEQNFEICENISDAAIKKTCQNRIAEELLEESGLEE